MKKLWNYFSLYEKIWFFSVLVLSVLFCFLFPETDDPTYTLTLSGGKGEGEYTVLDFRGTEDDFVLQSVSVNGIEYGVGEFTSAKEEYTVTPDMPETLRLTLPVPVTASDTLEILCYPDGDSEILTLNVADKEGNFLYSGGYPLTKDASGDTFSVKENPQFFVSVGVIMALYLLDTLANVLCELLISKQSRYNFLVSLLVEAVEIALCVVCMYRFATLAVTLFFWIPCDIISFVTWSRHKDCAEEELTVVKKLTPWQDVLVVAGILIFTAGVGYLLTFVDVVGGVFGNNIILKNVACYLDACVSAVGIVNGTLILLRYREQWIAWYVSAALETVINILAGQYVLLVLKAGYFTNTTYGYLKWTGYIKSRGEKEKAK